MEAGSIPVDSVNVTPQVKNSSRIRHKSSDLHFLPPVFVNPLLPSSSLKRGPFSQTSPLKLPKIPSELNKPKVFRKPPVLPDFKGAKSADSLRTGHIGNSLDDPLEKTRSKEGENDRKSLVRNSEKTALIRDLGDKKESQFRSSIRKSEKTEILSLQNKVKTVRSRSKKAKNKMGERVCSSADIQPENKDLHPQKANISRKRQLKPLQPNPALNSLVNSYVCSCLSDAVRQSNGFPEILPQNSYKIFIGLGNNDQLIALLMKRRWYWTRVDNRTLADFIWTENRVNAIVQNLEVSEERILPSDSGIESNIGKNRKKVSKLVIAQAEMKKTGVDLITKSDSFFHCRENEIVGVIKVYNRLERNYQIISKKWLFVNMRNYYEAQGRNPFLVIPLTFLIQDGETDPEFGRFEEYFSREKGGKTRNIWIVKPGENTNCGHGIHVSQDIEEIKQLVSSASRGKRRTFIIQKYLEQPLLVHKRKFDIRCYGLITCFQGHVQGYFYHDGYLRTSSKEFTLNDVENRFIHLTNDAVQKTAEDYGRFENGNKLSYTEFQRYLEVNFPGKIDFWKDIWTQIRVIMIDTYKATWDKLDPYKRKHTFEVLGYDFMIDQDFRVWLIEVNTNPCLSLGSTYLSRLIPAMLDNAFRITIDPYFPEPASKKHAQEWTSQSFENRFELVFSSFHESENRPNSPKGSFEGEDEDVREGN